MSNFPAIDRGIEKISQCKCQNNICIHAKINKWKKRPKPWGPNWTPSTNKMGDRMREWLLFNAKWANFSYRSSDRNNILVQMSK